MRDISSHLYLYFVTASLYWLLLFNLIFQKWSCLCMFWFPTSFGNRARLNWTELNTVNYKVIVCICFTERPICKSEPPDPDKDKTVPCCWLITWSDFNATLCPSLGTPVARAEVDTAVAGSLVPCGAAKEHKGQRSPAFKLKERTGDGEVTATHSRNPQKDRKI